MQSVNESNGEGRTLSLTVLEKSVLTLFGAITFAMLSWVVFTTNNTATEMAVVKTAITFIQKDAERAGADRFTGSQGRDLERRVLRLEEYHSNKSK